MSKATITYLWGDIDEARLEKKRKKKKKKEKKV